MGPDALEEIMCHGRVQIVGLDTDGIPVVTSPATRTIPPAVRHTVAYRDGVYVIAVQAVTALNLTTSHVSQTAAAIIRRILPPCAGTTTMLPSTATATG